MLVCKDHSLQQPPWYKTIIWRTTYTMAMFTRIHLHCENVLICARLILTFTLSHINEYPKRTDLKTPTKADTYETPFSYMRVNR